MGILKNHRRRICSLPVSLGIQRKVFVSSVLYVADRKVNKERDLEKSVEKRHKGYNDQN